MAVIESKFKVDQEVWFFDPTDSPKEIIGTRIAEVHYNLSTEEFAYELLEYPHQTLTTKLFPEGQLFSTYIKAKNAYDGVPATDQVGSGWIWYNKDWQEISGTGTEKIFLLRLPEMGVDGIFEAHWRYTLKAQCEFQYSVYFAPTYTDMGTQLPIWNTNAGLPQTGYYSRLYEDPVITDYGTLVFREIMGSDRENPSGYKMEGDFILEQNGIYIGVAEKLANQSHWLSWHWRLTEDVVSGLIIPFNTTTTTTT